VERSDAADSTVPTPAARPHVVLVGMMGSGKSTSGRVLATRLGFAFADADVEIERTAGRTIRAIFADDGEATFRQIEAEVLAALLARAEPTVIAAGGGAVLALANRTLARQRGLVVWLRAEPATLIERVATRTDRANVRPLLDEDPASKIERLVAERRASYEDAADLVVDVDALSPNAVADSIMAGARRS
jgi:shikimate kinase